MGGHHRRWCGIEFQVTVLSNLVTAVLPGDVAADSTTSSRFSEAEKQEMEDDPDAEEEEDETVTE